MLSPSLASLLGLMHAQGNAPSRVQFHGLAAFRVHKMLTCWLRTVLERGCEGGKGKGMGFLR
jgi:hypothetical protein